ncbi:MAG: hypothetical protein ABIS86_19385 [Streptosporangiaceae bacterium]
MRFHLWDEAMLLAVRRPRTWAAVNSVTVAAPLGTIAWYDRASLPTSVFLASLFAVLVYPANLAQAQVRARPSLARLDVAELRRVRRAVRDGVPLAVPGLRDAMVAQAAVVLHETGRLWLSVLVAAALSVLAGTMIWIGMLRLGVLCALLVGAMIPAIGSTPRRRRAAQNACRSPCGGPDPAQ